MVAVPVAAAPPADPALQPWSVADTPPLPAPCVGRTFVWVLLLAGCSPVSVACRALSEHQQTPPSSPSPLPGSPFNHHHRYGPSVPSLLQPHCPIVYGSMAFWLGKRTTGSDREHSHRWTIYLRGAKGFDVATCIKSVTFTLHHSFAQPNRGVCSVLSLCCCCVCTCTVGLWVVGVVWWGQGAG